jgi:hypothetical protein
MYDDNHKLQVAAQRYIKGTVDHEGLSPELRRLLRDEFGWDTRIPYAAHILAMDGRLSFFDTQETAELRVKASKGDREAANLLIKRLRSADNKYLTVTRNVRSLLASTLADANNYNPLLVTVPVAFKLIEGIPR